MINIKGKNYVMVNERIKEFRSKFPNWCLITEIVNLTEDECVMKASVIDENGIVKAVGCVQEAKQLGIQTKTPEEIAELKSLWSEYEKQTQSKV